MIVDWSAIGTAWLLVYTTSVVCACCFSSHCQGADTQPPVWSPASGLDERDDYRLSSNSHLNDLDSSLPIAAQLSPVVLSTRLISAVRIFSVFH